MSLSFSFRRFKISQSSLDFSPHSHSLYLPEWTWDASRERVFVSCPFCLLQASSSSIRRANLPSAPVNFNFFESSKQSISNAAPFSMRSLAPEFSTSSCLFQFLSSSCLIERSLFVTSLPSCTFLWGFISLRDCLECCILLHS